MSDPFNKLDEVQFDSANLWREEVYTDRKTGMIRVNIPVTTNGDADPNRAVEYYASSQIMTGAGALPVEGLIEGATTLEEAVANFGPSTKKAVEEMIQRAQEMQREQANQIITPGQAMGGMGGMPPGAGGGGLIV